MNALPGFSEIDDISLAMGFGALTNMLQRFLDILASDLIVQKSMHSPENSGTCHIQIINDLIDPKLLLFTARIRLIADLVNIHFTPIQ